MDKMMLDQTTLVLFNPNLLVLKPRKLVSKKKIKKIRFASESALSTPICIGRVILSDDLMLSKWLNLCVVR